MGAMQDGATLRGDGNTTAKRVQIGTSLAPLTPEQARIAAQALAGKAPDELDVYYSREDQTNYLAIGTRGNTTRGWLPPQVWLYKQTNGGFKELWHETIEYMNLDQLKLVLLPGDKYPSLRFASREGGSHGGNTRLDLYSVGLHGAYHVDYHEDYDSTPHSVVTENLDQPVDPKVVAWLRSWARELHVVKDNPANPNLNDPDNMEEAWVKDNHHMKSGLVHLRYYERPERPPHIPTPPGTNIADAVSEGHYVLKAIFRGGVVGYDRETRRYFMIYLPDDRYDSIQKLAVRGPWVYMSSNCFNVNKLGVPTYQLADRDCEWTVRFNTETHNLERGQFDAVIKESAGAAATSGDMSRITRGQYENTLQLYCALVRQNPKNANAHFNLGALLSDELFGDLNQAIPELRTAILLDPNMAEAHKALADALLRNGDTQGAKTEAEIGARLRSRLSNHE
jgi:hypothetical protein